MKKGKIILFFGISGVGKTYFKNLLIQQFRLKPIDKVTTREKRNSKKEKIKHISKDKFKSMIKNNDFFIYTKIYDEYYGYKKEDVKQLNKGISLVGDCYYKLIVDLRKLLGDDLIAICIQPEKLEDAIKLIKEQRNDYEKRIIDAKKEYRYLENNKQHMDYYIYTKYNNETDNEIISLVSKYIQNNKEESKC